MLQNFLSWERISKSFPNDTASKFQLKTGQCHQIFNSSSGEKQRKFEYMNNLILSLISSNRTKKDESIKAQFSILKKYNKLTQLCQFVQKLACQSSAWGDWTLVLSGVQPFRHYESSRSLSSISFSPRHEPTFDDW